MTRKSLPLMPALGALLLLAGCMSASDVSVSYVDHPAEDKPATVDPSQAAAMISAYRVGHGLPPVTLDPTLMRVAADHAQAMAASGTLDHVLPGEGSFEHRVESHGYDAGVAAEDIGAGYHNLNDAFSGWRASPHHNENMLRPGVTQIGIAVAYTPKSKFRDFWSLVLAAPADKRAMRGPDGGPVGPASLLGGQ